jgi:MFS family permease
MASLWRSADFRRFWSGEAVSELGSEVTALALPLAAVTLVHATAFELGLLRAAWTGPQLLLGLVAGQIVDRVRRRRLMIGADLGRALALAAIPLAALLVGLDVWLLVAVAFVVGAFDTLFAIAYQAFLPSVVPDEQLTEGNGKLQTTYALAQVAGPGLGGALVQAVTAPVAILADSLSFLVSAVQLGRMRVPSDRPAAVGDGPSGLRQAVLGWRLLYRSRVLRAIGGCSVFFGLCYGIQQAVLILYLVSGLHLRAAMIGVVFGIGSLGAVAGAAVSGPAGRRWLGPALVVAIAVNAAGATLIGVASGPVAVPLVVAGQLLVGLSFPLYFVNTTSLRQAVSPRAYLGRITAAFAMISWGMIPLGALIGGLLPFWIGLRATVVVGGAGKLVGLVFLVASPVLAVRSVADARRREPAAEQPS